MIFWILLALLTVGVALAALLPFTKKLPQGGYERNDEAVFKQQLEEIDRDCERGVIKPEMAEAARIEVSRRLLAAHKQNSDKTGGSSSEEGGILAKVSVAVVMPLVAIGLYLGLGTPNYADQPLEKRLAQAPNKMSVSELIARTEQHLASNPKDVQGWKVIAPVYSRTGQYGKAATAYRNILALEGEQPDFQIALAETLVFQSGGDVTEEAFKLFQKANEARPDDIKIRFYLALGLGQLGKTQEAIDAWQAILAQANGDEGWIPAAKAELATLQEIDIATKGPTAADMEAAGQLNAKERTLMIEGMVSQLEERLSVEGGSVEEWGKLMRAQQVLGRDDEALETFEKALKVFQDDTSAIAALNTQAVELGIKTQKAE
ncbi:c-type cytochrome biogenesis protein CcmI [Flexibacterium corallicola]|uniref:c-type cytochrome biogenesis protein CcmI n=1 Tax=Flexibacterium corallicola TaxID=3037259 RepID=UPI00286F9759|nr:c-type cytochrome biogenesis protein CcmI [Pseudovibrio sp. M1P-2-3]